MTSTRNPLSLLGLLLVLLAACLCSAAPAADETPAPSLDNARLTLFTDTLTDDQLLAGVALLRDSLPPGLDPLDLVYAIKNGTDLTLTPSQLANFHGFQSTRSQVARRDTFTPCQTKTFSVVFDVVSLVASLWGVQMRLDPSDLSTLGITYQEAQSLEGLVATLAEPGSLWEKVKAVYGLLGSAISMIGVKGIVGWMTRDLSLLEGIKMAVIMAAQLLVWFGTDGLALMGEIINVGVGMEKIIEDSIAAKGACTSTTLPTLPPASVQFEMKERFYNATATIMEAFYLDPQGAIHHRFQREDLAWTDWELFPHSKPFARLAAGRNLAGHVEVAGITNDGALWKKYQDLSAGGAWTAWENFGGWSSEFILVSNADGRQEIFAAGSDNRPFHRWQESPNSGWSNWDSVSSNSWPQLKQFAAVPNQNGYMELFGLRTDGGISRIRQTVNGNAGWESWEDFQASGVSQVVATRNQDIVEAFCIGSDQRVWHRWQNGANSRAWATNGWVPLYVQENSQLTKQAKQLAVAQQKDGRPVVFLIGLDNAVYLTALTPQTWSPWVKLGGNVSSIKALTTRDGIVQVYALFSGDKNVYMAKQLNAADPLKWTHWLPLN